MGTALRNLQLGPTVYDVSVAVTGGQLVEPDGTTGKVKPATAGSIRVLGAAMGDAQPPIDPFNPPAVLDISRSRPRVAVEYGPCDIDSVTYSAPANFGQPLVCTGSGQVGPAGAAPDPGSLVGRCTTPSGVLAGAVGSMRLF